MLVFSWDTSQIEVFRSKGLERAVVRTVSKAGGDSIRAARVSSSRTVRFRKRMKAGKVNDGLRLAFPRGARELDDLEWRVDVSGEIVPVASFPHRQTRKGVSVAINKGKRVLIRGAFVVTLKSGHTGVFTRRLSGAAPKKGRRGKNALPPRVGRLKIDEAFTTRISDVFHDAGMVPAVHARAQAVFSASFARLLPLELAKGR